MNPGRFLSNQRGVTLMVVLVMVVVIGLTAGLAGTSWRSIMQRVKETELLWRGDQYRKAIEGYYGVNQGGVQRYPARLEDLLLDPRSLQPVRYLRQLYPDPFTGEDWVVIKDPAGGIRGVRSGSEEEPFKKDDFPEEYAEFKDRMKYSEWEFSYTPPRKSEGATGGTSAPNRSGFSTSQ
jgi:type II secretory pathway pseudopilin PulG